MATKTYAIVNEIVKETEKAVLVSANGETWLPKSQITVNKIEGFPTVVELPTWLWFQKKMWLSLVTNQEDVYNTTGVRI